MKEIDELKERMRTGVVAFEFKKKDGTIREAHGTLKAELFSYIPKGPERKIEGVTIYFDVDKDEFRSFRDENYIGMV